MKVLGYDFAYLRPLLRSVGQSQHFVHRSDRSAVTHVCVRIHNCDCWTDEIYVNVLAGVIMMRRAAAKKWQNAEWGSWE